MRLGRLAIAMVVLASPIVLGARCVPGEAAFRVHVLNRIGFGPDEWTTARIARLGARDYIVEQLRPNRIRDTALEAMLVDYPTLALDYPTLRAELCGSCALGDEDTALREAVAARILRAVHSRRQLQAVLEDLWFDYFNVDARVGLVRFGIVPYVRDAIRPHVLGRFEDMLLATARAPAMLEYLDNRRNYRAGTFTDSGIPRGPNENYARELLELHTVGVDANFTESDVRAAALALTGWTIGSKGFKFREEFHDTGPKSVLGLRLDGLDGLDGHDGEAEGQALIRFLARHPATARRVSRRLVEHFVGNDAPELVALATRIYLGTRGNLRRVTTAILLSDEFREAGRFGTRVKRPSVLLASAIRATGASTRHNIPQLRAELRRMGESPYEAPAPTGYPEGDEFWASAGSLLTRLNFVYRIAVRGGVDWGDLTGSPVERTLLLSDRLVTGGVSPVSLVHTSEVLAEVGAAPDRLRHGAGVAMLLSSPEFLHH